MQEKHQKRLYLAILISETSHVFCCVLPTIFSVLSILAGIGLVAAVPGWLTSFHDAMHDWEVPLISASALVVAIGWGLYFYSKKIDCHDTGCHHGPCGPKKRTTSKILIAATLLLAFNMTIYFGLHRGADQQSNSVHYSHEHHEHDHP